MKSEKAGGFASLFHFNNKINFAHCAFVARYFAVDGTSFVLMTAISSLAS